MLRQHSTTEIILHYLLEENMHKEINELLIDRLPKYVRIVDRNHEQDLRQNRKDLKKVCHIPNSHMEIYTRSLMLQVGHIICVLVQLRQISGITWFLYRLMRRPTSCSRSWWTISIRMMDRWASIPYLDFSTTASRWRMAASGSIYFTLIYLVRTRSSSWIYM